MPVKYPRLQSGYLALSEKGLTQQLPQTATFAETILFTPINHEYDNLFYSGEVSKLFMDWQADCKRINKFDFRSKILKLAMDCFGFSVLEWLSFQSGKPDFSTTHRQFLQRMVPWILPGTDVPYETSEGIKWIGLIGPSQGNNVSFNVTSFPGWEESRTTTQAIQNWVARDGGYESLLVHLYVIFGQRVGHTQRPTM